MTEQTITLTDLEYSAYDAIIDPPSGYTMTTLRLYHMFGALVADKLIARLIKRNKIYRRRGSNGVIYLHSVRQPNHWCNTENKPTLTSEDQMDNQIKLYQQALDKAIAADKRNPTTDSALLVRNLRASLEERKDNASN